jgi:EmrB/QacA subfamily drug resistance transporter
MIVETPIVHRQDGAGGMTSDTPSTPGAQGRRRWGALAVVCLAVVVIVMDGSIVNVALPTLAERMPGVTNSHLQWFVDAYILAFASILLTVGVAADRFGRRRMLLAGLAVFGAMSAGAALAATPGQLIVWRTLMGLGAAMIFPATLAIITDAFTDARERRLAIAMWAGVSGLGVAIGPVAGGWLLTRFHWGAIFLVNIPLIIACIAGVLSMVRESRDPAGAALDPIGNCAAMLGVFCLVWGLIEAPTIGWTSWRSVGAFGSAAALLGAFVRWERRSARPMLDLRYFADPRFSAGCAAITAAFFGLFGFVFMVTQYFQFVHRYDALAAGLRTTPFAAFILAGAVLAPRIEGRIGARALIATGLLMMGAGFAWTTRDTAATAYLLMVLQMGLLGVGLGMVNAAATEAIMGSLPLARAGTGSSVNDTAREVGGAFGVAVMGSLFNAVYRAAIGADLARAPLPAEAREAIRQSIGMAAVVIDRVEAAAGAAAAEAVREPIVAAFLQGFHAASWVACAATTLGAAVVWLRLGRVSAKFSDACVATA